MRCENRRTQKQQRRPFQHGNVETEVDASESTSVLGAEKKRTSQRGEAECSQVKESMVDLPEVNIAALDWDCDENATI